MDYWQVIRRDSFVLFFSLFPEIKIKSSQFNMVNPFFCEWIHWHLLYRKCQLFDTIICPSWIALLHVVVLRAVRVFPSLPGNRNKIYRCLLRALQEYYLHLPPFAVANLFWILLEKVALFRVQLASAVGGWSRCSIHHCSCCCCCRHRVGIFAICSSSRFLLGFCHAWSQCEGMYKSRASDVS